jgi:hypothetical protein
MHNDQKRRKYKRIEKLYTARVRVKQHEGHEADPTVWDMVAVKDLGAAGIFFYYKKDLGIGTLLDLKIDVSKSTPTINCVGRIKRIEEPIPPTIFGIATEFTEIEEQEKEIINATIEEILE